MIRRSMDEFAGDVVAGWVEQLRISGADFDRDAAEAAQRIALRARRSGASEDDAFQAARTAYYSHLQRNV